MTHKQAKVLPEIGQRLLYDQFMDIARNRITSRLFDFSLRQRVPGAA